MTSTPEMTAATEPPIELRPYNEFNRELQRQVAPLEWRNPRPDGRYNLVVIGAGTAGLVTAAGAAGLGAKVALVERKLMGGDCLNVGCVPSKGIIRAARVLATCRDRAQFGISDDQDLEFDFSKAMDRMRRLRASISPADSATRFTELGVDLFLGNARFTGEGKIDVDGTELQYAKAVIATGARAAELPIDGLSEIDYLTNESVFSLTELPKRLLVIGAGPIGSEMAQTFARFGSQVTQLERSSHPLSREDEDAAAVVQAALERDGVRLVTSAEVVRVEERDSEKVVIFRQNGAEHEAVGDELLIGLGRAPNVTNMGLETVGVQFDERRGVEVNDRLKTTNPSIFAAGDVASKLKFTHAADFMARIVIQNALFRGRKKFSSLIIPWVTYTSPELAHVGLSERDADEQNIKIDTYRVSLDEVDRAVLDGQTDGFVKIHTAKGRDKILGATIVAANAGEMINEVTMAMQHGIGLGSIANVIHPYPTQAEAIRKAGDQYNRSRLTPLVKSVFDKWLAWTR